MNSLPEGWTETSIGAVCEINPKHSSDLDDALQVSFVPMGSIDEIHGRIADHTFRPLGEVKKGYTHFADGDVIFAKITPCMENGNCAVAENLNNGFACGSTEFFVFRPSSALEPKYLYRYLRQEKFRQVARKAMTGAVGQARVPKQFMENTCLPLPPLDEQRRIVAKLDVLFEKSRSIREKLDRLPRLLANLQKSILNSAFRGTDNWKAASVGSVLLDIRYGTSKKCQSEPRGTAVLRIPNIGERGIQIDDLKYAEFTPTESARLALDVGDLLLIRSNGSVDLVGKTAVVSKRETGMLYAGYLIRMRVNRSLILPEFLHYWLMTPSVREIIERTAKSTSGVNNINSEEVRSLPLLLPPLEVQTQICARVAQAFSSIDRLSATFDTAAGKVGMMDMSILSKAFRGELVPQDPNDEPASVLLERIRAQKPVAGTKRGRGRKAAA